MSDNNHRHHDEEFSTLFAREGWTARITPEEVIERWRTFGADCIDGYPWDIEDYLNDITMRSTLKKVRGSLQSVNPGRTSSLMHEIAAVDASLQLVFEREVFPDVPRDQWWMRRAPSYAAQKFCHEFKEAYKVAIRPMSKFDDDVDAMKGLLSGGMEPVNVCIKVKRENWYVTQRPGLLFRACKNSIPLNRREIGALWSWASGELPDGQLRKVIN